jgi:ABC-2 type transport system ATP-binding protein
MSLLQLTQIDHFYGRFQALRGVSLQLPPGAIGLIGQNGAGKSTLLKILMGLQLPTSGEGSILGFDLRKDRHHLRRLIGFMPEAEASLPGVTGVDLVGLAGELSGMPRKQALRRAHEVLSYLELGEARYRRCEEYSVGMKQRLKLAAALVHDPTVLLLDEPTAGLDPAGREAMLNLLQALASRHGKSLILSTHLLGDIDRICPQVIILDRGQLLGVGPIADLKSNRRRRYRVSWQFEGSQTAALVAAFADRLQLAQIDVVGSLSGDGRLIPWANLRPSRTAVAATASATTSSAAVLATTSSAGSATMTSNVALSSEAQRLLVELPPEGAVRSLFQVAAEAQLVLREVVPEQEDLPQLYHRLVLRKPAEGRDS